METVGLADQYLELVDYSFRTMRKELRMGYSWAAFGVWSARFVELKLENQRLIREYAAKRFQDSDDVKEVVGLL